MRIEDWEGEELGWEGEREGEELVKKVLWDWVFEDVVKLLKGNILSILLDGLTEDEDFIWGRNIVWFGCNAGSVVIGEILW